ncbi:MAG: cysteine peptidase family C39 domain-containing protein [Alphaproteobacteria bacterium]|nr:cysteine peptidase family C39 domain-containing protein [Alphaproteobacteria bacterium]MCD8570296.1 cysteine peptidase family C39 domain-containing protein [Alphaproteobacteria bacterium]
MIMKTVKHLDRCNLYTWDTQTEESRAGNWQQQRPLARLFSQTTKYSCGAASLCSVASILGIHLTEEKAAEICGTKPGNGTCNQILHDMASQFLPVKNCGMGVYSGGLAIANIRNQISKGGHYVVLLGMKEDYYRYFCPKIGTIVITHRDDIRWVNASETLKEWALCFDANFDPADKSYTTQGLMS